MKRIVSFILVAICVLALAACAQNATSSEAVESAQTTQTALNKWGITLKAENVTPSGLTLVCEQSGGENVAELTTGSSYFLQKSENGQWQDLPYASQDGDIVWTSEAWIISMNNITSWDVNWEWLYGQLSAGEYRIGKEISNFRGPGDYEKEIAYAYFVIQ